MEPLNNPQVNPTPALANSTLNSVPIVKKNSTLLGGNWKIFLVSLLVIIIGGALVFFSIYYLSIKNTKPTKLTTGITYEGAWRTPGLPNDLPIRLTIVSIENNNAVVRYEWTTTMGNFSHSITIQNTSIKPDGKTLTWNADESIHYIFTLREAGQLEGRREENGKISTTTMNLIR